MERKNEVEIMYPHSRTNDINNKVVANKINIPKNLLELFQIDSEDNAYFMRSPIKEFLFIKQSVTAQI